MTEAYNMGNRFAFNTPNLSIDELKNRVDNNRKYQVEAVEAALAELQYREYEFEEGEIKQINQRIEEQKAQATIEEKPVMERFIVDDPNAIPFYSRGAIFSFTVVCGALFGSILLAINLERNKSKKEIAWVLIFGVIFTAVQIAIINYYDFSRPYSVPFGLLAAVIIDGFFNKFIGTTPYRARSIWGPLVLLLPFLHICFCPYF